MSEYTELAYSTAIGRVCLFTGTGFSKAITNNKAPSWQDLLEFGCSLSKIGHELRVSLFPADGHQPLSMDEIAQVISLQLEDEGIHLHSEVSRYIQTFQPEGNISNILAYIKENKYCAITTNYDHLLENLNTENTKSIYPGIPVPLINREIEVYHVHGSVHSPHNMILTSEDYFHFTRNPDYFSHKINTILNENTVIILGYSLGDTNLKHILQGFKSNAIEKSSSTNIFFVSNKEIENSIKSYYLNIFGIRVIDNTEIDEFFKILNQECKNIFREKHSSNIEMIREIFINGRDFNPEYLKYKMSFYEITSSMRSIGISIQDNRAMSFLTNVITQKKQNCAKIGNWREYAHLAEWIIYFCQLFEIKGTAIETLVSDTALWSMNHSSNTKKIKGKSWDAYHVWIAGWKKISLRNRQTLRQHVVSNTTDNTALEIVNS